jgi:F0F1-type ATP synthase epsilon subunit
MSILKNHISIIAFLRPGIVKIEKSDGSVEEFFVQDGTIEFFKNILVLLSSSAKNIKDFLKKDLEILKIDAEEKLSKEGVTDEERYVLNHKLDAIKGIRV